MRRCCLLSFPLRSRRCCLLSVPFRSRCCSPRPRFRVAGSLCFVKSSLLGGAGCGGKGGCPVVATCASSMRAIIGSGAVKSVPCSAWPSLLILERGCVQKARPLAAVAELPPLLTAVAQRPPMPPSRLPGSPSLAAETQLFAEGRGRRGLVVSPVAASAQKPRSPWSGSPPLMRLLQ